MALSQSNFEKSLHIYLPYTCGRRTTRCLPPFLQPESLCVQPFIARGTCFGKVYLRLICKPYAPREVVESNGYLTLRPGSDINSLGAPRDVLRGALPGLLLSSSTLLEVLAGRTLRKGKFGILLENPAARVLARYLPIIGNIHGAFEIFNPESTPPERVLAAFGVIPGLGNLIKITGNTKRLSALARWAANTTDGHRVFDVVQFLGDVDALGDWSDRLPDVGDMWRASHLLLDAAVSRMPHATSSAA